MSAFTLPDTIGALPVRPFEYSSAARGEADAMLALPPDALFHRTICDQESEATWLAARRIIHAFLSGTAAPTFDEDAITDVVADARGALTTELSAVESSERQAVLRQRAPLSLLAGCWLDMISQPATQPAIFVNRLYAQHFALRGGGEPLDDLHRERRRSLEVAGIDLPEIAAADFLRRADARPLTSLHACFYLALSRLPANFLPEVVGVHYAFYALAVDDVLAGTPSRLTEPELRNLLTEYLTFAGPDERRRLRCAVALTIRLEREHVAMLRELASWRAGLSLESRVADIIARHAPMAGRQHGQVRVGDALLADRFSDPHLEIAQFLREFREAPQVRTRTADDISPFIQAMKFGGPMFGIFTEHEAAVFREWVASAQSGERPDIVISPNRAGDAAATGWVDAIASSAPPDIHYATAAPRDDREWLHQLTNIENFPNTLPLAEARAREHLAAAELLFAHGASGRYTDASYFDYSAEALFERGQRVYWDKLVNPYRPLEQIPSRDEVVFMQTTYALGSLIDGAWIHRMANLGHRERESDEKLFAIYADEMGHGDLAKNHITLVHRVLASMSIELPHIRDEAFMRQAELPDDLYRSGIFQLCMCMFPDTFYNEILGYNFGIEMFGSGEFRLHEIQKLRHYGFDDCYEQAHLTIDNFSAGHTRQAADIIVSFLDGVRRASGEAAVQREWRRVWRGYAAFSYFVEHKLVRQVTVPDTGAVAELVI
jgi:hypothetical protein